MKRKEAELLLKTSLESEKQERKRIAADIHDGVSGDLNAIKNFLAVLYKKETSEDKKALFDDIKTGVEAAIENTRLVSYKLMPPLLETSGFLVALQDYFTRLNSKTKAKFSIKCDDHSILLSNEISYELFRILQELTTNMIKYGQITSCEIYIKTEIGGYDIIIKDDGIPFNFKEMYAISKGTGLKNISSRLKVIDAIFKQNQVLLGNEFVISVKNKLK
ncbi:sensor histidine kinase [Flavobacterium sp. 9AF]|uniref:sensor histidine kinase n=1 Tax=Flavobacterium sp. 9AF TaxID=2653142 RepID=UPI0013577812|nr:histidine kinase [Flavobacterium sp. 9AF]